MVKVEHEIVNHGWTHEDYFQGFGVSFTRFNLAFTGIGNDAVEAWEDVLEQLAQFHFPSAAERNRVLMGIPRKPRKQGITRRNKVPGDILRHEENYHHYYVSLRLKYAA